MCGWKTIGEFYLFVGFSLGVVSSFGEEGVFVVGEY